MAVCFFNYKYDYEHKYKCEYEIVDKHIVVSVEYDIMDEIEPVNGARYFGVNTVISDRDILIVDYKNKINYLLKEAYYAGSNEVYGSPDGCTKAIFRANIYFSSSSFDALCQLKETPKISLITIVSRDLCRFINNPSLTYTDKDDELLINLTKRSVKDQRQIGINNIKELSLHDHWAGGFNKSHSVEFDLTGYLDIKMSRRINYTEVPKYVYEAYIYLQLYTRKTFSIDKIKVDIDGIAFDIVFHMRRDIEKTKKYKGVSVKTGVMDFLEKCYHRIPYRNSKSDIRNIPYTVLDYDRNIEDSFLMYYRFIECYYKRQNNPKIKSTFIAYSLSHNTSKALPKAIDDLAAEIVSLRNHYTHSGYFIKNNNLRVKFKDNSKGNYTTKVSVEWIYERMSILYDCSIDIIFRNMLEYEDYEY